MSKRKQILLILVGMAVLLAALGILLGMVLSSEQQQSQPVAEDTVSDGEEVSSNVSRMSKFPPVTEDTVSDGEEVSSNVSRMSKFPPVTYVSVPENHAPQQPPKPLMPDNFELDCPPPTEDQLYPGATEEVDYLTYAEPALSMNDTEFLSCGNPIQAIYSIPFVENRSVDYYEAEQVSIQEALKADNLIFWWQYEHFMWGDLQVGCPVQYYRVLDYEPVTVIGVTTKRDRIPRRFAVRDGVIQAVAL